MHETAATFISCEWKQENSEHLFMREKFELFAYFGKEKSFHVNSEHTVYDDHFD